MASGDSSNPASAPAPSPIISANPNPLAQASSGTFHFSTPATSTTSRPARPASKTNDPPSPQKHSRPAVPSVFDSVLPKSGLISFSRPVVEASLMTASDFTRNFIDEELVLFFKCNGREYRLHKSPLTSNSPYFRSLLSSDTQELTAGGAFLLKWDEPWEIAFRSLIQFLYTSDYNVYGMDAPYTLEQMVIIPDPINTALRYAADANHIHVYLLADRLGIPELKVKALGKYNAPFDAYGFPRKTFPGYIEKLAELLYHDASGSSDILGEGGVTGQKEPEKEATKNSTKSGPANSEHEKLAAVIASEARVNPDLSKLNVADPAAAEASSTIEDSRRSMQEAFARRIAADTHNAGVSEVCNRLMMKGGQFAQNLYQFMRTAKK